MSFRIINIDFQVTPEPAHVRTLEAIEKFVTSIQTPTSHFQSREQMEAWMGEKLLILECLCRRIVGVTVPVPARSLYVPAVLEHLMAIKEICRFDDRDPAGQMVDGTIA